MGKDRLTDHRLAESLFARAADGRSAPLETEFPERTFPTSGSVPNKWQGLDTIPLVALTRRTTLATANSTLAEELAARIGNAVAALSDCVEVNPEKRSGVPVLKGTRLT